MMRFNDQFSHTRVAHVALPTFDISFSINLGDTFIAVDVISFGVD